ncbi:MAG: thioesterase family protein [Myxococcales bacterium]|nr:thioesterase family protein [Myxococcales bacterium]
MTRFFEQVFGVYFDDLDPFHVLHNARYLLLFERALGAYWMEQGWGSFQDTSHPERFHLVARNEIDYVQPVRGVCRVRVRVWVDTLGTSSLTFGFRMLPMDADVDHARGKRVIVHVDPATLAASPWPATFREAMKPWLA